MCMILLVLDIEMMTTSDFDILVLSFWKFAKHADTSAALKFRALVLVIAVLNHVLNHWFNHMMSKSAIVQFLSPSEKTAAFQF